MVSEYMQNTNFYNKTKAESDILGWLTIAIPFVVAVFIIYWLIPALTYTLYLETFDVCKGNRAI